MCPPWEGAAWALGSPLAPFYPQGSWARALGGGVGVPPHSAVCCFGAMPDSLVFLFQPLGQAETEVVTHTSLTTPGPLAKSLSPPSGSPPLLSLALGLAAAFFLRLR